MITDKAWFVVWEVFHEMAEPEVWKAVRDGAESFPFSITTYEELKKGEAADIERVKTLARIDAEKMNERITGK